MSKAEIAEVEWVHVPCPLCGADEADPIYERDHETGSSLGRLHKVDVLCRSCSFMYTSPRPSAADMGRYYREAIGASGSIFHSLEPGSRLAGLIRERVRFMESTIQAELGTGSGRMMDLGCASGDLLAAFTLPGWRKQGLDPSPSVAEFAARRGLDLVQGEIETAELEGEAFDAVSCISALEHVWDMPLALGRIAEALRPGGLAFMEVPDSTRPIAQIAEFYSFEHLSHFTRSTLLRALGQAGLEPVAWDESVGIPNLRVCARRCPEGLRLARDHSEVEDRQELVSAIDRYRRERGRVEAALVERLEDRVAQWERRSARVALYGAGMHTRFLMEIFDLGPSVACMLDSDPAKAGSSFLGWRVHAPDELPALELDAILISTQAFEQEVYDGLQPAARKHGIEVVRCYG